MSEDEAIDIIKIQISRLWDTKFCGYVKEAFEMAIKALEKQKEDKKK